MISSIAEAVFSNCCPGIRYTDEDKVFYEKLVKTVLNEIKSAPDNSEVYANYRCDKLWKDLNSIEMFKLWIEAILK